jgi:hypothetical protein
MVICGTVERGNLLARQDFRQHPRSANRIALQAGADAAAARPRQFLHRDDPHEIVDLGAAVFLRKSKTEQPDLRRLLVQHARKGPRLVPFMGVRLDLLLDKAADHVAIGDVLGGVEGILGHDLTRKLIWWGALATG